VALPLSTLLIERNLCSSKLPRFPYEETAVTTAPLGNQHQHYVSTIAGTLLLADRRPVDEIERLELVIAGHETNRHCEMQPSGLIKVSFGTMPSASRGHRGASRASD